MSTLNIPPGVQFLVITLARGLIPTFMTYGALTIVPTAANLDVHPPKAFIWIAAILATPALLRFKSLWTRFKEYRERNTLGAVPIPTWKGKWPGNFDLLMKINAEFKNDYLGGPLRKFFDELGNTWCMDILLDGPVFTLEPEHIKQVLATEFGNYEKGKQFHYANRDVLGNGVFNADGDLWKFHRSMTRPFFSRDRISHFNLFERHADKLISLMIQRFRSGLSVDAQDAFSRFTLDSATEFLFGSCVHSLKSGLSYPANANHSSSRAPDPAEEFARAFADAQEAIARRNRLGPLWPLLEIFENKTTPHMQIVDKYLDPILTSALENKKRASIGTDISKSTDEIHEDETLLDHLVKFTDDKDILKDEILNIMIAGRDTTASTLTFATYLLSMYPESAARLRNEILSKIGPTKCPTYDDIREMKYLRAFINETLRLFPAVPFDGRRSKKGTTLAATRPGGKPFYVPADTEVNYSVLLMHRRTDLWGPDADEFDPDRFLDERLHKYLTPNPFIFVPFNAGPRICLGQQFAYNEASFMLVRLLQTFDQFELDVSAQPQESIPLASWKDARGRQSIERCWPASHLTLYARGGMWVRMREAAASAA